MSEMESFQIRDSPRKRWRDNIKTIIDPRERGSSRGLLIYNRESRDTLKAMGMGVQR
jgi:hypothetical protein